MVGEFILVDTNILIFILQGNTKLAELLSGVQVVISVITEMEIQCLKMSKSAHEKVQDLLFQCTIIELNPSIKTGAIELVQNGKLKLPDAIIAATAQFLEIPVFTADKQFERLESGNVILFELDSF